MFKQFLIASTICVMPLMAACSSGTDVNASEVTVAALTEKLPNLTGDHVWNVDRSQSKLQFRAEHNGDKFTGNFGTFDSVVKLNLDDPSGGEIHAVIDLASIDAKDDDRNANLPSKAWFDMKSYPLATYSATEITGCRADGYVANGMLSIKGIERPVQLRFTVDENDGTAKASGTANFMRQEFNLGTGSDFETEEWVKFPIEVLVSVSAKR